MEQPESLRQPWRLGARRERWFDVATVVALLVPVPWYVVTDISPGVVVAVLAVLQIVPLLWRRKHPDLALACVVLGSALQLPMTETPIHTQVAFPIAVYSAARFSSQLSGLVAVAVGELAAVVAAVDWIAEYDGGPTLHDFLPYFFSISAFVVTAWAFGSLGRTRAAHVAALVDRGERLRLEGEQKVALASAAERARIAREMHDVVAHGLTVMVVQADGARYASERDPAVAAETLDRIAITGREALSDMRQLLGLLRSDGTTGRNPLPGLDALPELLTEAARHGNMVSDLRDVERAVPTAVGLTTYRVVQEALSNVRSHAGPGVRTRVTVAVTDDAVIIDVVDDGRGAAASAGGGGHGLTGMRERVAMHGGELKTGPCPGGGFGVSARIPL